MDSTAHDSWPFLDREHEVAAVLAGATGPAALAGVAGVHGVGKTALLRAVEKALTGTGWRVARLSGNGSDATVATLASLTGVRGGDHDLFDGARAALLDRLARGRVALLVDDAHLLDVVSAAFVEWVAEQTTAAVVIAADSGGALPPPLARLWRGHPERWLELMPLPPHAVPPLI